MSSPVLHRYRELLRLISRLPQQQRAPAAAEARSVIRERSTEKDPQLILDHQRQLASKIAYLRMVTPRRHGDVEGKGTSTYVLRDGRLVEGSGDSRGTRVADGVISHNEAMARNNRDFKRFYGGDKPKGVFF